MYRSNVAEVERELHTLFTEGLGRRTQISKHYWATKKDHIEQKEYTRYI